MPATPSRRCRRRLAKKVITVRTTVFKPAEDRQRADRKSHRAADPGLSKFVGEALSKSERPELTSAKIVISGGRGLRLGGEFQADRKDRRPAACRGWRQPRRRGCGLCAQ